MWITKESRITTEWPHSRRLENRRINQTPPRSSSHASKFRCLLPLLHPWNHISKMLCFLLTMAVPPVGIYTRLCPLRENLQEGGRVVRHSCDQTSGQTLLTEAHQPSLRSSTLGISPSQSQQPTCPHPDWPDHIWRQPTTQLP